MTVTQRFHLFGKGRNDNNKDDDDGDKKLVLMGIDFNLARICSRQRS